MSAPLSFLNHGDITIEQGSDTNCFGFGDLFVNRSAFVGIGLTVNSVNPTTGNIVNYGGLGVVQDSYLGGTLTVSSVSNLQTTFINTNLGPFSVNGENGITMLVGDAISITSTGGNTSIMSLNNTTIINGGFNGDNAIELTAINPAGGISLLSGLIGQIKLTSGIGGIQNITSSGNINLIANNGNGNFIVNSSTSNQNLTLSQNGMTDSGILIQSFGTNISKYAIHINTINTLGNIYITNNSNGSGSGQVNIATGSGGYTLTTNTNGPIRMTASDAASYFIVNTTSANSNLTISVNGNTNSALILQSSGINSTQAILIQTTNTRGSILLNQPANSNGKININSGSGGFNAATQIGGGINFLANGAYSSFINQTTGDSQDLKICVQGSTGSKLILCSHGVGSAGGILLTATGNSGGIFATAAGPISINTSDSINGINIGNITTVPVNIGTSTSTTTILGNLDVRGITTTFESTVIRIADNIIELNSAPSGISDGGLAVKRYQPANNTCSGAVVNDTPENSPGHLAQATGNTITTIKLNVIDNNQTIDYYAGYWIKIISGTGSCQVRRIKSYDPTINIATIYSTVDQMGILGNPTPIEGLDFITVPDSTSLYGLYPCEWIVSVWDESLKTWSIVCSNYITASNTIPIAHYVDLHINDLIANNINASTINNSTADKSTTIVLTDNSTTPVIISDISLNYGLYIILIRPTSTTNTRCSGIFLLGRLNTISNSGVVNRIISVKGTRNEQLDMQWAPNTKPGVFYRPAPGTATVTSYTLKIISV